MVQDPNVERMISEAIAPLTKEIKELKRQIEALKQVNEFAIPAVMPSVCEHPQFDILGCPYDNQECVTCQYFPKHTEA